MRQIILSPSHLPPNGPIHSPQRCPLTGLSPSSATRLDLSGNVQCRRLKSQTQYDQHGRCSSRLGHWWSADSYLPLLEVAIENLDARTISIRRVATKSQARTNVGEAGGDARSSEQSPQQNHLIPLLPPPRSLAKASRDYCLRKLMGLVMRRATARLWFKKKKYCATIDRPT